ncbi:hypothetical protein scyTo_0009687 [Scyliorhinus torazame]|uniref:Uncharacterized protein n=1 Tax=Scyliorhinus torazame TaxID=75743 RepID=A0A401NRS5_SCYTO|nr:hypothetical protein [Scyliorhinus torazame]
MTAHAPCHTARSQPGPISGKKTFNCRRFKHHIGYQKRMIYRQENQIKHHIKILQSNKYYQDLNIIVL